MGNIYAFSNECKTMNTNYLYSINKTSPRAGMVLHTCKTSNREASLYIRARKNPSNTSLFLPGQLKTTTVSILFRSPAHLPSLVHSATKSTASTRAPSHALNFCNPLFMEIQVSSSLWFQPTLNSSYS